MFGTARPPFLEGLSEIAHAEKIAAVQKEALSQVLPTERDTLAGAIKTLTSSLATTVQLKLRVADLAHSCIRNDEDEDRAGGRTHINELDTPTLRKVHAAMQALTGQRAKAARPPSPPPPEPIEDFPRRPADNPNVHNP